MKRVAPIIIFAALTLAGCGSNPKEAAKDSEVVNIIMETDIGNDIDDALAMDLLYKYLDAGKINLLAVNINKEGTAPAEYVDILNTWYGYPDIPIGVIRGGADCENDATNYAKAVVDMKDSTGTPTFARTLKEYDTLPDAHILYRKILAEAEDESVVIASVGFSTNLIRLLETQADEYSELSGKDLVAKKVKLLVTMAGDIEDPNLHEYNVVKDIPAAKIIFEEWPTPVVTSPFEVGIKIQYPGSSIENDFAWAGHHPVVEAYKAYQAMPYDRPTWDPTAILYAVEGGDWFTVSSAGNITVTEEGSTIFTPGENGTRKYLSVDQNQADSVKAHFIEMITSMPDHRK
ncbi:MAG TPA: nucleoside hydrolase [Rikenellaceae bacterium]|nr:nucleoside hydrolase [Rikenellaceae bacterium]